MSIPVPRNVLFRSAAFNTTEPKDYFINDCCFGDDVAQWLMEELKSRGVETGPQPGQEDFGWYFSFRVGAADYDFVIVYRPGDGAALGDWIGTIERSAGFFASLFGARSRGIQPDAREAIDAVLSSSPLISDVRWFSDGHDPSEF